MFLCSVLDDGVCVEWVEFSTVFSLSLEDGLKIGGLIFVITAIAWGFSFMARFILNR